MSKLSYTVRKTNIDDHKLAVTIRHGKTWISTIFCDSIDLSKYAIDRNELDLYDKDCKIIVSFFISMSQLKGIEHVDVIVYR